MKWIFVLLLVANVAYFVLEFDNRLQESTLRGVGVEFNSPPGGERLVLASELERPPELQPSESEDVAQAKPEPAAPDESKDATTAEPNSAAPVGSEDTAPAKPEPAAPAESEDAAPAEPEPAAPAKSEDAAPAAPEPAAPAELEDAAPAKPEPAAPAESEDAAPVEPEPAAPAESEDAATAEPEPAESEDAVPAKPELATTAESEDATPAEPEPAESEDAIPAKPEPTKGLQAADPMASIADCVSAPAADPATDPILEKGCYTIGIFQGKYGAAAFSSKLTNLGAVVGTRDGQCKRPSKRFVVFIPPLDSDALVEKKVAEIRAKGVKDLFVYRTGVRKNGVSLGIFSKKGLAVAWQRRLIVKGISAMVVPDYHVQPAYWLDGNLSEDITESLPQGVSAAKIPCNQVNLD